MSSQTRTRKFLREKRLEAGLSQADLGQKLNLHPQFVSNWERGLCAPPDHCLPKLCRILKINKKELLDILLEDAKEYFKKVLSKKK